MLESYGTFHASLSRSTGLFLLVYLTLPLLLEIKRWIQGYEQYKPAGIWRKKRVFRWLQQSSFVAVVVIEVYSGIRHMIIHGFGHIEASHDDLVHLFCLLMSLALDRRSGNADRWRKVLWTPFYLALCLYQVSNCLEYPSFSHGLEAFFCCTGILFNWVQLFISQEVPQMNEPPEEYLCGMIGFLSFGFITEPVIKRLYRNKDITVDEIPSLVDHDTCRAVWEITKNPKLSFYWKLFSPIWSDFLLQSMSQFTTSILTCVKPLVLGKLVWYVTSLCATKADPSAPAMEPFSIAGVDISIEGTVLLLLLGPIIQGIADGQLYSRGRHLGIRIRSVIISLVYQKILRVDLTATAYSVGKVNNLISVDASAIQSYMVYTNYLWSTQLEIALCIFLLYKVLGPEAFVGICVIVSSVPICYYLTEKQKSFQTVMLQAKDERMAAINELLNSIRIIKLFAWEDRFKEQVEKLRASELSSLWGYTYSGVAMYIITDCIPTIVAMATYLFRIYVRGEPLSAAEGYMALLLFNMIKRPLQLFPEMVGWGIQAYVAMERIAEFLDSPEILGTRMRLEAPEPPPPIGSPRKRSGSQAAAPNPIAVSFRHATMSWYNVKKEEDTDEFDKDSESVCTLVKNGCSSRKKPAKDMVKDTKGKGFFDYFTNKTVKRPGGGEFAYSELDLSAHDEDSEGVELTSTEPGLIVAAEGLTARVQLYNINADITRGSLVGIIGPTGSGKSTILSALLGECLLNRPDAVVAYGEMSYAPQSPWIRQGTVRDNITFGLPFDEERYQRVVFCCSLLSDFELLPLGDQTEIGEKGVNLSGGQKQRVSLARAAYSYSDVILMDDVLSAVDAHVGEHIFRHLICDFLTDRTRLLVTNQLALVLPKCDFVICIGHTHNRGASSASLASLANAPSPTTSVIVACHPKEISSKLIGRGTSSSDLASQGALGGGKARDVLDVVNEGFISLLKEITDSSDFQLDPGVHISSSHENLNHTATKSANLRGDHLTNHHHHSHHLSAIEDPADLVEYSIALGSGSEAFPASTTEHGKGVHKQISIKNPLSLSASQKATEASSLTAANANGPQTGKIISEETRSTGSVSLEVYLYYFKACGGPLFGPLLVATMVWNSASWYFQNYSMGLWLNDLQASTASDHTHGLADVVHGNTSIRLSHLGWFLVCCASVVLSTVAKNIYTASGGLKASQVLHDRLVHSVLHTSCAWFDATPVGRISNRFSQDVNSIDRELLGAIRGFLECFLGTTQVFVAVAINMPLLLALLLPVIVYVLWCTFLYIQASRELKRLESVAKSPVFVLFSETLNGLSTIRAFNQENRFFTDMCIPATDTMNATHLVLWMSNRWLSIRMTCAGAIVGGAVGLGVVLNAEKLGGAAAGLVLILALNLTDSLIFLARSYADVEMNLNSVERVYEYTNLPSEQYEPKFGDSTASLRSSDSSWPSTGKVEFRGVCMKYDSNPEPILRGVSFTLMPRCKAGVVGRTGAGKSSLINVLFRLVEPNAGSILVDGLDVLNEVHLQTLRAGLAIVPQDPVLFKGTIRSNLDPFNEHTDAMLWDVLRRVRMIDHVSLSMEGEGLGDKQVSNQGANLSVGQRQLLCMARALLRKSCVLVMDEATANVDPETDLLIQETIRTEFDDCTVLCIAHRLHTVASCDRVLVMDRGQVAEFDSPISLMRNPTSIFYSMCEKSGNFATLFNIAADYASQVDPDGHGDMPRFTSPLASANANDASRSSKDEDRVMDLMGDEYMSYHIIDL